MFKVQVGDPFPKSETYMEEGVLFDPEKFKGKWPVIFFYPKDDTPGCTNEAKEFKKLYPEFLKNNAQVIGVSIDSLKKHAKFSQKHEFPFPLVSDENKELVNLLGIYGEKKFMGKTYLGTHRTSVLLNPEGTIEKLYEKVNPLKHPHEVLADILSPEEK